MFDPSNLKLSQTRRQIWQQRAAALSFVHKLIDAKPQILAFKFPPVKVEGVKLAEAQQQYVHLFRTPPPSPS